MLLGPVLPTEPVVLLTVLKHLEVEVRRVQLDLAAEVVLHHELSQLRRHGQHNLVEEDTERAMNIFGVAQA